MLQESDYTNKIKQMFRSSKRCMPEVDFTKLTKNEIVQYGYLTGAKKFKSDIDKNGRSEALNLPSIHQYTSCELNPSEATLRHQNSIFYGSPGTGKTFLSAKLAKDYFCSQFIPEEYRESEDFFDGQYAQGILNSLLRKIVFVSETHCLDMFSRNIQGITAKQHFANYPCYGSWDLKDLSSADMLVIQDIGSRKAHPQYAETLFGIFDTRFEDSSKVTVFTTNADKDTLADIYGEMFADRLKTLHRMTLKSDSKRVPVRTTRVKQKFEFYT